MKFPNEPNSFLKPGERLDDLQRNGLRIIQNREMFCFGMDAVLLSGFARVKKGETTVDLGTGTGIIPVLLSAKTQGLHFTGLEIQPEACDMARRSVALNGLSERIDILEADIRKIADGSCLYGLKAAGTDVVCSNPPYMKAGHGLLNPQDTLAVSRHEICCTLFDVCRAASVLLRDHGRLYMVHRPQRLSEIICFLKEAGLEPKRIKPVYPSAEKEATMVLIEAVKNAGSGMIMEKPLIIYREKGVYTDEIYDIYGY